MTEVKSIYRLTDDEVKSAPFVRAKDDAEELSFYPLIRKLMDKQDEVLDCTKICVARNIQDSWMDYFKAHGIEGWEVAMMLVCSAPKVDESLADNEVSFEAGWAKMEKEEN